MQKILLWLNMMVPIAFSAGPANIAIAAFASRFGIKGALPFFFALNMMVLINALVVGAGMGKLFTINQALIGTIQIFGVLYLFYLAIKFYKSSAPDEIDRDKHRPRFSDGIILQLFNMKMLLATLVMYSQFLQTNSSITEQVLSMSFGIVALTMSANMLWGLAGTWLGVKLHTPRGLSLQRFLFSFMLSGVALWMLFETIIGFKFGET